MISWVIGSIAKLLASTVKVYFTEFIKPLAIEIATNVAFTCLRAGF